MKYKINYGSGKLLLDIDIKLSDILTISPSGKDTDETRVAERPRDIDTVIENLYLKSSENNNTKKVKNDKNNKTKKVEKTSKYDREKMKKILTDEELKFMEKYVFSFKEGNKKLFKEYWGGRKKENTPLITVIFLRCMLKIKKNHKGDLFNLWRDVNLMVEEFDKNLYTSKGDAIGFLKFKVNNIREEEKERLGQSINNKYKSNRKIRELSSVSIDDIIKELIIADDPNNGEDMYSNMIIMRDSLFKIIEYRRNLRLSNQIATDRLMEEIIKLYNILPRESRYDATYKNLIKLKEGINFKIEEIDNYKNIYKREAIKSCKIVNEYKDKEEKLIKYDYIEEAQEIAEKCRDVETQFNKKMRKNMDMYTDMSLKRTDLEVEEMDMKKYEDDNIMNSMIKLIEDINS